MKKLAIAGASAVLAAMPVVGVFAADGTLTQTDTVVVTVDSACSLATSGSSLDPASTYTATIANGAFNKTIDGSTLTITCNDVQGWKLNAVGAGTSTKGVAYMDGTGTGITESDDINTGTTLDGTVSDWAFKLTAGTEEHAGASIVSGYTDFSVVPTTATKVASGTTSAGTQTVTATYGVGISPTQNAGTYTGKVSYTLVHPDA